MEHFLNTRQRQKIVSLTLLIVTVFTCCYVFVVLEVGSGKPSNQAIVDQSSLGSMRLNRLSLKEADRFHQSGESKTKHDQIYVTSEPSFSLIGKYLHPGNPLPNYFLIGGTQGLSPLDYHDGALVFLHHNKAAGSSVKTCFKNMFHQKVLKREPVLVSQKEIIDVNARFENGSLSNHDVDVFMGDYDFGLCRHFTKRNCSYFTFLRDPVDRVISSYFYCMNHPLDQLCGPMPVQSLTIQEWAIYQGSYFYRQLLVDPAICRQSWGKYVPCWFKEKTYHTQQMTAADHRTILNFILKNLDKWFSVIGLTEEFERSLDMISHTYNYSFNGKGCNVHHNAWNKKSGSSHDDGETPSNQRESHDETKQAMRTLLQTDPDVMRALEFDIKIYDVGKRLFERQHEILKQL